MYVVLLLRYHSDTLLFCKTLLLEPYVSIRNIASASHNRISAPLLTLPVSSQVPIASVFLNWSLDFTLGILGFDSIVPLTMKGISDEVEGTQFRVRNDDACGIALAILDGSDVQAFFGGGVGDQLNDRF